MDLTQDAIKEKLTYDPDTGLFTWKEHIGRNRQTGKQAGVIWDNKNNRRNKTHHQSVVIGFGGKRLQAHRLAFLYMTGEMPIEVDHRNRNPLDNRWCNLRAATRQENSFNKVATKRNQCGYKGMAYYPKNQKPYQAFIKIDYKPIYLGSYDTAEAAHQAYRDAASRLHGTFANFG